MQKHHHTIELPLKNSFAIKEIAKYLSLKLSISEYAAAKRIYRAIDFDQIKAQKHLGSLRIKHSQAQKILKGKVT